MLVYSSCFLFFSLIVIISSILVVSHRNQVIAALNLILCFFASAGLFMLLGAEFIAMSVVVVYVGAVAVLFLFVIMMLDMNQEKPVAKSYCSVKYISFSFVLACVLLLDLYLAFKSSIIPENIAEIAKIPFIAAQNNIKEIGKVLYTDYSVPFICAGIILLVAMIGSIVLTLKENEGAQIKKQNINEQLARNKENGLKLVKAEFKKGIK